MNELIKTLEHYIDYEYTLKKYPIYEKKSLSGYKKSAPKPNLRKLATEIKKTSEALRSCNNQQSVKKIAIYLAGLRRAYVLLGGKKP